MNPWEILEAQAPEPGTYGAIERSTYPPFGIETPAQIAQRHAQGQKSLGQVVDDAWGAYVKKMPEDVPFASKWLMSALQDDKPTKRDDHQGMSYDYIAFDEAVDARDSMAYTLYGGARRGGKSTAMAAMASMRDIYNQCPIAGAQPSYMMITSPSVAKAYAGLVRDDQDERTLSYARDNRHQTDVFDSAEYSWKELEGKVVLSAPTPDPWAVLAL